MNGAGTISMRRFPLEWDRRTQRPFTLVGTGREPARWIAAPWGAKWFQLRFFAFARLTHWLCHGCAAAACVHRLRLRRLGPRLGRAVIQTSLSIPTPTLYPVCDSARRLRYEHLSRNSIASVATANSAVSSYAMVAEGAAVYKIAWQCMRTGTTV